MSLRSKSAVPASCRLSAIFLVTLAAASGASAATLSVGPGKTYAAPCAAFAKAQSGDIIQIDGGKTYSGDVCAISASNLTIRGVNGRPKIDAAGKNAQGKGTWVVQGNNTTVENVEMAGAAVPDRNGAAVRVEGTNFTLRSSYLHDNENGILTGANVYIGHVGSLTFRYNYSHDANGGHNLKSRASVNTINYNRFSSSTGKPSYEIDLPNAGTSYVIGNVIHQPASHNNPGLLAYGNEGASNPKQDLYVVNNTFLNDDSVRGTFVLVGGSVTTPVLLQNNIFGGTGAATNQANAIDRTNFRSLVPGFINRLLFDLHPIANVLVINAGSVPGVSAAGVSLTPVAQYKHTASGETRTAASARDIGAYAALTSGGTPAPAPAPAPTPSPSPSTWTTCANENATCGFSGTREVRYGAGNSWVVKVFTNNVQCSNAVFGDPIEGTVKTCSYAGTASTAPTPAPTTPVTWTACAAENGTCSFTGTRDVRYGVPGAYATKAFTTRTACTNAVFGDPIEGTVKSCSYSSQAR
jgi:hypothetical protein